MKQHGFILTEELSSISISVGINSNTVIEILYIVYKQTDQFYPSFTATI